MFRVIVAECTPMACVVTCDDDGRITQEEEWVHQDTILHKSRGGNDVYPQGAAWFEGPVARGVPDIFSPVRFELIG